MTEAVRDALMNTPVEEGDLTLASVNSIDDYWDVRCACHFAITT